MSSSPLLLFQDLCHHKTLVKAIFSSPRSSSSYKRIEIRPIVRKQTPSYQISRFTKTQAFHENREEKEVLSLLAEEFLVHFKQALFQTTEGKSFQILLDKEKKATILSHPSSLPQQLAPHNREKSYFYSPKALPPFFHALGLASAQGEVFPHKMDKFRQIHRFLELVEDALPPLSTPSSLHLIEFGCGKAYLTFALYHYLRFIKGFSVEMVGVDLKEEVLSFCASLAKTLSYDTLHFVSTNIEKYTPLKPVAMVLSLHACNQATDMVLKKSVAWKVPTLLASPCCEHEAYHKIACPSLDTLLLHGILKERFAALATNAIRVDWLQTKGYKTQIVEFIDVAHTPKNLLIRAHYGLSLPKQKEAKKRLSLFQKTLHLSLELLNESSQPAQ